MDIGAQYSRQVFADTAAGDVREPLHRHFADQVEHRANVNPGWREQQLLGRLAVDIRVFRLLKNFANQGITIGMWPAGRNAHDRIARRNGAAVDNALAFHYADTETSEIVLTGGIHVRHLCCFTSDQRGPGLLASVGDTANDAGGNLDIELAAGEIVEEKQRLGALYEHIVDTHGDQIDANRVMLVQHLGQLQFGADAVGAGDQDRF